MVTILILHGWGSGAKKWQKIREILENQGLNPARNFKNKASDNAPEDKISNGVKVFIPDLPGFGESQIPDRPWTTDDYVNWTKKFIQNNINSSFFLIGHSFGGKIAFKIALQIPERALGLILISPPIFPCPLDLKAKILGFCWKRIDPFLKPFLRFRIFQKIFDFIRRLFYLYILKNPQYLKFNQAMKKTFEIVNKEDFSEFLPQVKTKTLIIWGEKDKIVPLKYAYLIKEKISNSQLKIMPKIGHRPHLEDPEKLSKIILQFL